MMFSRTAALIILLVAGVFLSACGATATPVPPTVTPVPPTATPVPVAPSFDLLKNLEYQTDLVKEGRIKLADGRAERSGPSGGASDKVTIALVPPFAAGDVNGDGAPDAVSFLSGNTGGSGTFISLVVILNQKGTLQHIASASLGDRVRLHAVSIASGQITVNLTVPGPKDPLCCPSQEVTRVYQLEGGALKMLSETPSTRPLPTTLAGTEWTLVTLGAPGAENPVLPGTTLTAAFSADGKISGSGGCNTFSGGYTLSGVKLTVSALGSAKKACSEPKGVMEQENAYLTALQGAAQFSMQASALTLMDASSKPILRFWLGK